MNRLVVFSLFLLVCMPIAFAVDYTYDFESNMNDWQNDSTNDFDWSRNIGQTTSTNTGSVGDHTTGSGYYLYTETSSPATFGDVGYLDYTPNLDGSANKITISFWYHYFGNTNSRMSFEASNDGIIWDELWGYNAMSVRESWQEISLQLDDSTYDSSNVKIRFKNQIASSGGSSFDSDASIDDVSITLTSKDTPPITNPVIDQITLTNSIDGGLFILMLVMALLCFVLSLKYGTVLLFITIILMLSLGIILIAGYDVTFVEYTTVNNDIFSTTKCLICDNGEWFGWTLFLFGVLSLMFFLIRTFKGE